MKKKQPCFKLLFVDDEPHVISAFKRVFHQEPYECYFALDGLEAMKIMAETSINTAIIDYMMPGMDGLTLLKKIRENFSKTRVFLLTGRGGVKEAVKAIKFGAVDFLEKPYESESLKAKIAQEAKIWCLERENQDLKIQVNAQKGYERLIGNSDAMLKLKTLIYQVARSNAPILIQGETGTGKELVAHAIHKRSSRCDQKYQPVDCGSISESVMGSELFGHVKGAFTGAHTATLGLIRSADRGTLFLDEVGELSLSMQVKLLRTIQEKQVRPVGDTKSYAVDLRLIAATNRDLEKEVEKGSFREDLFFRLNVIALTVPPLRERIDDIPLLAGHFVRSFKSAETVVQSISDSALDILCRYKWPGNVRELENVIRRAVAIGQQEQILLKDLPSKLKRSFPDSIDPGSINISRPMDPITDPSLAAYEKAAIANALVLSNHNRKKAATILGVGEATLYRKIKKYNL
jgi:DNA-binding NtrC family response regulator